MAKATAYISYGKLIVNGKSVLNFRRIGSVIGAVLRYLILIGISYVILYPLIVKLSSSVMTRSDIWDPSVLIIPKYPSLNNYKLAFRFMEYPLAFWNSFKLAFSVSSLQLISCTLVGYGFARYRFFGNGFWFSLVIFSLVIPPELILIPLYLNFRFFDFFGILPDGGFNLLGSAWPFILPAITASGFRNGLYIYIMRQIFRGAPKELEEAAYVDGAGPFRTFFRVVLPGSIHGLVVVFLFSFVWMWNDYSLTSFYWPKGKLLPIMLSSLTRNVLGDQYLHAPVEGSLVNNAGSFLIILPLLLLYAFLQRYFVESIERTGLVG
ncbi:MAG: carbohydrate ABC transporter permease [Firmicutes bacterium]|jgi:multiple sugar transport system permease protein|nr:carbohydrate ABC transporter permease [Bacillota bacterium]NLL87916.1 carbohydrate ABC transporter permease [Bacillota bacterium]